MNNDIFTEHKLIILYFLSSINSSINLTEITTFLIENNYTDYLQAGQYLSELSDSKLVNVYQKDNKVLYKINEQGKQTLDLFEERIPDNDKNIICKYLEAFKDLSTNSIHASFTTKLQDNNNKYTITCSISKDKDTLFEINLPNISEDNISIIRDNWENNKLSIMKEIRDNLL